MKLKTTVLLLILLAVAMWSFSNENKKCVYAGKTYSHGSFVKQGESCMQCANGEWFKANPEFCGGGKSTNPKKDK